MEYIGGFHYINTGDWVESCTAVAEHQDGTMEMIQWHGLDTVPAPSPVPAEILNDMKAA